MCNDHYQRRRREAEESRAIWQNFEQAPPFDHPEPPADAAESDPIEVREAIATPER